jgi:hypothetical protein
MNKITRYKASKYGLIKGMSSNEWIHEHFADLLGFSEDTSIEFIIMICTLIFIQY